MRSAVIGCSFGTYDHVADKFANCGCRDYLANDLNLPGLEVFIYDDKKTVGECEEWGIHVGGDECTLSYRGPIIPCGWALIRRPDELGTAIVPRWLYDHLRNLLIQEEGDA